MGKRTFRKHKRKEKKTFRKPMNRRKMKTLRKNKTSRKNSKKGVMRITRKKIGGGWLASKFNNPKDIQKGIDEIKKQFKSETIRLKKYEAETYKRKPYHENESEYEYQSDYVYENEDRKSILSKIIQDLNTILQKIKKMRDDILAEQYKYSSNNKDNYTNDIKFYPHVAVGNSIIKKITWGIDDLEELKNGKKDYDKEENDIIYDIEPLLYDNYIDCEGMWNCGYEKNSGKKPNPRVTAIRRRDGLFIPDPEYYTTTNIVGDSEKNVETVPMTVVENEGAADNEGEGEDEDPENKPS
jgi:hypothetical protein